MDLDIFDAYDLLMNPPPDSDDWISPAILPKNSIMLCGGLPKLGKSLLAVEFARALVTGTLLFDYPEFTTKQCNVLYLEGELGKTEMHKRLSLAFENHKPSEWAGKLYGGSQLKDFKIEYDDSRFGLNEAIEKFNINVCIFDPIRSFTLKDENSNNEIKEVFDHIQKLKKIHEDRGLSFILIHHFRKEPTGWGAKDYNPLDPQNFSGAGVFYSAPDTLFCGKRTKDYKKPVLGKGTKDAWLARMGWVLRKGPPIDEMILDICPEGKHVVKVKSKGKIL